MILKKQVGNLRKMINQFNVEMKAKGNKLLT